MSEDGRCKIKDECHECEGGCSAIDFKELLGCPFCGGDDIETMDMTMDDPCYAICCNTCSAAVVSQESFLDAKDKWQKRSAVHGAERANCPPEDGPTNKPQHETALKIE